MTGHDSGTTSCRSTGNRGGPRDAAPDVAIEVRASVAEQVLHTPAAVVAGDVGVDVLPDALDAVGIGALGRQEVEEDAVVELLEDATGRVRRVDGVVTEWLTTSELVLRRPRRATINKRSAVGRSTLLRPIRSRSRGSDRPIPGMMSMRESWVEGRRFPNSRELPLISMNLRVERHSQPVI